MRLRGWILTDAADLLQAYNANTTTRSLPTATVLRQGYRSDELVGTWFWIDPVNDLGFIGMIQNLGGNRPGGITFRADSATLVYAALARSAIKSFAR